MLNRFYVDNIINTALAEDINYIDVTTDNLLQDGDVSEAYFVAKDSGILCGIDVAARVLILPAEMLKRKYFLKTERR